MPAIKCPKCGEFNKDDMLQCRKCGSPVIQPLQNAPQRPPAPGRPGELSKGQILANRFSVIKLIGRGGMGSIYQVHDNVLGETVAVKTLLPQFAQDKALVERFFNEARIARKLSHPNIVRVHDIGSAGESIYISMELLEGRSLREILESMGPGQRLPISETLRIMDELCQALEYAHQFTVHRDIKPENVMLNADGVVKLMDFGISKLMANTRLTQQSMVMGTPFYMSPEQLRNSRDVDARADIFSVGVMLYEILTGNLPSGVPKPASQLMEDIPPTLDNIVTKCVDLDPDKRFQNATELRNALRPIRELLETGAKRTFMKAGFKLTPLGTEKSELGRKIAGVLIALLLAAGVMAGLYFSEQRRVALSAAVDVPGTETEITFPNDPALMNFGHWAAVREQIFAHTAPDKRSSPRFALHYEQGDKLWAQAETQQESAAGLRQARDAIQFYLAPLIWPEGMRFIPPGAVMLDGAALPVPAFFIDETEVTYKDFARFCNEVSGGWRPDFSANYQESFALYPVAGVSYYDAQAYALWAKKSLPTRTEWCMAAYGPDNPIPYPWGNDWLSDAAMTLGNGTYPGSAPVKTYPKDSTWQFCYDMAGNVAEWTRTPADKNLKADEVQADFGMAMAVCGGHFESERVTFQEFSAVPYETKSPYIGFRCVKPIPSTPNEIWVVLDQLG